MSERYNGGLLSASQLQTTSSVEYLVVAGGGGGGTGCGNGGGAGGLLTGTYYPVSPGSAITVTVGAGGPKAAGNYPEAGQNNGSVGSLSKFGGIVAAGGGYGGALFVAGGPGGSGGGGHTTAGSGITGQGNNGGVGDTVSGHGGGGGGAGSAGRNGLVNVGAGFGGAGFVSSITGKRLIYAGGGGGGSNIGGAGISGWIINMAGATTSGQGGTARSDNPYSQYPATDGLANFGGGGGGGARFPGTINFAAGSGGSGVVVVRYPSFYAPAIATTGSPQAYTFDNWRVYVWTTSGSITF